MARSLSDPHHLELDSSRCRGAFDPIGSKRREPPFAFGSRDFRCYLRCPASTRTLKHSHGSGNGIRRPQDDDGTFDSPHGVRRRQAARNRQTAVLDFCSRRIGDTWNKAVSPSEKTIGRRTWRPVLPIRAYLDRFFHGNHTWTPISKVAGTAVCWRRSGRAVSNLPRQALRDRRVDGRRRWHNLRNCRLAQPNYVAQLGILDWN